MLCFEINKVVRFEVGLNVMLKTVSMEEKKAENKKCYNVIVINVLICYGITVYCTKKCIKICIQSVPKHEVVLIC